jgi:hypothetical protein
MALPITPRVFDDGAEQSHGFGPWLETLDVPRESLMERFPTLVCALARRAWAPVVAKARLGSAGCPTRGQRTPALGAAREVPQRKIGGPTSVRLAHDTATRDNRLHVVEHIARHERRERGRFIHLPPFYAKTPSVERISEHPVECLWSQSPPGKSAQPGLSDDLKDFLL